MNTVIEWKENIDSDAWDSMLTDMQGHPLQSAYWGDAKKSIENSKDIRFLAFKNGKPIFMARCEERRFLKIFKIAWVPQGPVVENGSSYGGLQREFFRRLKEKGFFFCVINPRKKISSEKIKGTSAKTIWIDLTLGKDKIWSNAAKQFRSDVRRSKKFGILIEKSNKENDIKSFYELCTRVSKTKKFSLYGSIELMSRLIKKLTCEKIESCLFRATYQEKFCGGAFVIRCGSSVHYMWAAVDRALSRFNIGEAIQWEIIEWALEKKCRLYDLEGIDSKKNPGTYHFKKKLGGEIITLPRKRIYFIK